MLRRRGEEVLAAALFLTRLPIRWRWPWPPDLSARAYGAFAIVGALVGLLAAGAYAAASAVGLSAMLAALAAVAVTAVITGALHEDGLADVADGIGGGKDRAGRLAIMRDSRLGTFGTLALVLVVAGRVAALDQLGTPARAAAALVVAAAVSRSLLPCLVVLLPPARSDGLARQVGRPGAARAACALGMAAILAFVLVPAGGAAAALAGALAAAAGMGLVAWRSIGGYTGDVLGASQQLSDLAVLVVLAAWA
ncbi:MAG: adenosylcobinamide-GDP ribazoletransferase [Rhodospirillaceae bacterium]|nr:adenosylcobinamide-GDP ribazoletransferase [Rhodospirillaceae bacterium]